jgi:hypothetical protein
MAPYTLIEAQEFFDLVKGCKIRISAWLPNSYFVPDNLKANSSGEWSIWGRLHGIHGEHDDFYPVMRGFENSDGLYWERLNAEKLEESDRCTCDIKDLSVSGCRCGAFKKEMKSHEKR